MIFDQIASFIVSASGLSGNAAAALEFWIYDSLKIGFLLTLVVFGVGFLRTYLPPEKVRNYLEGKNIVIGYFLAAMLGIISPFCSCSTIPIFLGLVGAGVPFGMTITFLVTSPMINEAAIIVLLGVLGIEITSLYIVGGVTIGILGGVTLDRLGFDEYVMDFDFGGQCACEENPSKTTRIKQAYTEAKDIIGRVFPYVLLGVGIGALIHGFVPQEVITGYLSGSLAVPAAVGAGVPIYTNIMGVIPVAESLIGKGLPIGTSMAFMMSVAALSLPEFVMLKQVMKKKLIISYAIVIAAGIIAMGLIFNAIF